MNFRISLCHEKKGLQGHEVESGVEEGGHDAGDYGDHGDGEAGNDEKGAVEALWPRLLRV